MLNIGIIVTVLAASSNGVLGILTETPQNTAILLNSKLQLNCSSDSSLSDDFGWAKIGQNGTFETLGSCANGSSGDYDFISPEPKSCHLVVSSATAAQDGIFQCVTFSESAVHASVSIIGEEPEIVGDLNNVTVGTHFYVSCNVSYLGDIVPWVDWIDQPNVMMNNLMRDDTQGFVMVTALLTSTVAGQYSIRIKVSFDSSSINITGLDPSLAVYVTKPLELYFMPHDGTYCTDPCLSTGEIIGIAFGCVAGVAVISLIIYGVVKCINRERKRNYVY